MTAGGQPPSDPEKGELILVRVFDAPRDLVFQMFTEPEHLRRWWGPGGWTITYSTLDLRPGGVWHYCMTGPEGEESWTRAVFREIVAPERLVFTDSFSDPEGNVVPPTHFGMSPEWPVEALVTITFVELEGKTVVTLRSIGHETVPPEERGPWQQGWTENLETLARYLATI